jgi:hypothetical protein
MQSQNGVEIYLKGEKPPIPEGLDDVAYPQLWAPLGYKVVEVRGRVMWTLATESDYQQSEAQRLGTEPESVKVDLVGSSGCVNTSPTTCPVTHFSRVSTLRSTILNYRGNSRRRTTGQC